MLTNANILLAINQFIALYNAGRIAEAGEFYAYRCYQTDGEASATSRDQIIRQLLKVTEANEHEKIISNNRRIVIAADRQTAMVWEDFKVGGDAAVAVLMLKWIDKRPQVIADLTML
jgi:hypothetical protein